MPTDPDNLSTWGYLAALLFGGGGAAKLVTHEGRIKSIEGSIREHGATIGEINQKLSTLEERSRGAISDRTNIEAKLDRLLERE